MSEGGLEPPSPGDHPGASEGTQTRPDQPGRLTGDQPGDIREHPDTPAPVSRRVSADAGLGAYGGPLSALRGHADGLGAALALWAARRADGPDAPARRAANDAMDAIDAALAGLHEIRARLVGEIRDSDDASAARADALLARLRGDQR